MANPTTTTQVDWFRTGDFVGGICTLRADSIHIQRGESDDQSGDAQSSCTITLLNDDAAYSPERNWCDNPSFETGTGSWSGATLASYTKASTIAQVTDNATNAGTKAMGITCAGSLAAEGAYYLFPTNARFNFRNGVAHTFQVSVKTISGSTALKLWFGSKGTAADSATATFTATASFVNYSVTWTPSANRTDGVIAVSTAGTTAAVFRVDAVQVNAGSTANTYLEAPTKGQLVPGQKVLISGTYSAVQYPLYSGYIERVEPIPEERKTNLVCYDQLRVYQGATVDIGGVSRTRSIRELRELILDDIEGRAANLCDNPSFEIATLAGWNAPITNIITNPSFDTNTTGWSKATDAFLTSAAGTMVRDTGVFHSTPASVNRTFTAATGCGVRFPITGTFISGNVYVVSAWLFSDNAVNTVRLGIGSVGTSADTATADTVALGPTWQRVSATWTPSGSRTDAEVYAVVTASGGTGDFYVDDVMVIPHDAHGGTDTSPAYYSVGISGLSEATSFTAAEGDAQDGTYALLVTGKATVGSGVAYDFYDSGALFTSGVQYCISAYVKKDSGNAAWKMGIIDVLGADAGASTTFTATTSWVRQSMTWTPSADRDGGVDGTRVNFYITRNNASVGAMLIDAIRVEVGATPTTYAPAWWNLGNSTESDSVTGATTGIGLGGDGQTCLTTLNNAARTRHYITPELTTPFYTYNTRTRGELSAKTSQETFTDDYEDLTSQELDMALIVNYQQVLRTSAGGRSISDAASQTLYGQRSGSDIDANGFCTSNDAQDDLATYVITRYAQPPKRPVLTDTNRWPSMLQRDLDELITVTHTLSGTISQPFIIQSIDLTISEASTKWDVKYQLEEYLAS